MNACARAKENFQSKQYDVVSIVSGEVELAHLYDHTRAPTQRRGYRVLRL